MHQVVAGYRGRGRRVPRREAAAAWAVEEVLHGDFGERNGEFALGAFGF